MDVPNRAAREKSKRGVSSRRRGRSGCAGHGSGQLQEPSRTTGDVPADKTPHSAPATGLQRGTRTGKEKGKL